MAPKLDCEPLNLKSKHIFEWTMLNYWFYVYPPSPAACYETDMESFYHLYSFRLKNFKVFLILLWLLQITFCLKCDKIWKQVQYLTFLNAKLAIFFLEVMYIVLSIEVKTGTRSKQQNCAIGWGGRWEGGSGWGTHVNPWLIHVMYGKNHYNILK